MPETIAIVLNYCRETLAAQCVEALARSAPLAPRILIVDNASPDRSGERLQIRFPQHDFLQIGENLGYAGGNSRGIAWALEQGAARILVINDDAELTSNALGLLEQALDADAGLGIVGPTIVYDDVAESLCWAGGAVDVKRALGTSSGARTKPVLAQLAAYATAGAGVEPCGWVSGCCLMIRAEAARALGGFREDYFAYGEDVELSLRYAKAGWRFGWVPAARCVHHAAWPEPAIAPWKLTLRDRNRRRMVRALYGGAERAQFAAWFWPTRLIRIAQYLLDGDAARAKAQWLGMTSR